MTREISLALSPLGERGLTHEIYLALSPLGERVARAGAFFSRGGTGEGVEPSRAADSLESESLRYLLMSPCKRKHVTVHQYPVPGSGSRSWVSPTRRLAQSAALRFGFQSGLPPLSRLSPDAISHPASFLPDSATAAHRSFPTPLRILGIWEKRLAAFWTCGSPFVSTSSPAERPETRLSSSTLILSLR